MIKSEARAEGRESLGSAAQRRPVLAIDASPAQWLLLLGLAATVTYLVFRDAWVSDDALITFRYVDNVLHGRGAVFNLHERVQGYTHPLWFLLLSAVSAITGDEVYAAILLGLTLTFVAAMVLGAGFLALARDRWAGLVTAGGLLTIFATSDAWRSFQTSGLEGSMATLLLLLFVLTLARPGVEAAVVLLLGVLLLLCHPDLALIAGPACALALVNLTRTRRWTALALALAPLLWFAFARAYYGDFLPNTGAAKLGIFTLSQALHQGLMYLRDWLSNEPVTAAATFALLTLGISRARRGWDFLLSFGLAAYFCYVLLIGGDFMRGRFYLPFIVGSCVYGGVALARLLTFSGRYLNLAAAVAAMALFAVAATMIAPKQIPSRDLPDNGIVNERLFYYPGYSLKWYRTHHRLVNPAITESMVDTLRAYVNTCGSLTLHLGNPSYLAFYVGSRLSVIDLHGLTDRYIARLPNDYLLRRPPRPGHQEWKIPTSYLARRGDVAILPNWERGVETLDCSLPSRLKPLFDDNSLYVP